MRRARSTTRNSEPSQRAGPDAGAAQTAEFEVPADYRYTEGDPLHQKVRKSLKDKAESMYDEAMENPNSDANLMVRILLLNQLASMETDSYNRDPRLVLTEERRRGAESERQAERDQARVKHLGAQTKKIKGEERKIRVQIKKLEQEVRDKEIKLEQAQRVVDQARVATEQGEPLDAFAVYNKIAEIVGLTPAKAPLESNA